MKNNSKLSFIIPVFNEEDSLPELTGEIVAECKKASYPNYEIIFIDDGSTDTSNQVIRDLIKNNKNIRLITLRKNFGKATALQAGFELASGDLVFTMDADLQDHPGEISNFIQTLETGYDLVSGWKYNRLDPAEKRLPSKFFNGFVSTFSGVKLHDFNCGFKLYKKEVIKSLRLYGELHRFIPVLASQLGFKVGEIKVHHRKRKFGQSKYGWKRYFRGFFDWLSVFFIGKFYTQPMYFFGKIGVLFFALGFLICFYLLILWLMGNAIGGRPLLMLGVLLLIMGFQVISMGLIGDMIVSASKPDITEHKIKEII